MLISRDVLPLDAGERLFEQRAPDALVAMRARDGRLGDDRRLLRVEEAAVERPGDDADDIAVELGDDGAAGVVAEELRDPFVE